MIFHEKLPKNHTNVAPRPTDSTAKQSGPSRLFIVALTAMTACQTLRHWAFGCLAMAVSAAADLGADAALAGVYAGMLVARVGTGQQLGDGWGCRPHGGHVSRLTRR